MCSNFWHSLSQFRSTSCLPKKCYVFLLLLLLMGVWQTECFVEFGVLSGFCIRNFLLLEKRAIGLSWELSTRLDKSVVKHFCKSFVIDFTIIFRLTKWITDLADAAVNTSYLNFFILFSEFFFFLSFIIDH